MDSSARVIADLRELAKRTSNERGAQRLCWGPIWRDARAWFTDKVKDLGLTVETDAAGNNWVTLPGASPATVIVGSHLDCVPSGGWLDGCFGVITGIEVLRRYSKRTPPPVTIKVVDWADEEGARFGRSLLGSAASAGTLDIADLRHLKDRNGVGIADALRENGVELENLLAAKDYLAAIDARAYLEIHIEQGPVLEAMGKPTGVVIGTFGVERHTLRFVGQAAHSGSTPIEMRKDSFLAAAEAALGFREIAKRYSKPGAGVVCTVGVVNVEPRVVTAVPGVCEISLDQRALGADVLAAMLADAHTIADRSAKENGCTVEWKPLLRITPRPFDPELLRLGDDSLREETGEVIRLPSGPLHDAAEMAPIIPTVMIFSSSSRGLSHCREEDTPEDHLGTTIRTFLRLVDKTVAHIANMPAG